jgi:hypothetical protein
MVPTLGRVVLVSRYGECLREEAMDESSNGYDWEHYESDTIFPPKREVYCKADVVTLMVLVAFLAFLCGMLWQ